MRARARARRVRIGVADQVKKILGTRSAHTATACPKGRYCSPIRQKKILGTERQKQIKKKKTKQEG